MAGFKRNNKPSKDFESELNNAIEEELEPEEDDYGFYDDEEDEIMEFKPRQQKKKEEQNSNTSKGKSNNSKSKQPSTKSNNTKMIGIGLVVGLAVIVILVGVTLFSGRDKEEEKPGVNGQQVESSEEMTSAEDQEKPSVDGNTSSNPMLMGNNNNTTNNNNTSTTQETTAGVSMEDSINPGLPDPEKGKQNVNNGTIEDASGFLVDINGNQIPQNYKVKKIEYETDFVSYVKKRGLTANGIELLWLDAEYKGHPYTVQVPFKIWKELDSQGITVVDMEVLYLENDAKVISYMKVKENYKEIMEKGEAALDR